MKSVIKKCCVVGLSIFAMNFDAIGTSETPSALIYNEATKANSATYDTKSTPALVMYSTVNLGTRVFDFAVNGNFDNSSTTLSFAPEQVATTIPDLFELNASKELVFSSAIPFMKYTMPYGRSGKVNVTLESIRDDQNDAGTSDSSKKRASEYLCLELTKTGTSSSSVTIYRPDSSYATQSVTMSGGDVLQLVPRVSTSNLLTGAPSLGAANAAVPTSLVPNGGELNLNAVYRVKMSFEK